MKYLAACLSSLLIVTGMGYAQVAATPAPAASPPLISFSPDSAEVAWLNQHWQLQVAGRLLKDFGRHQDDARKAQRLIRDLRLNQYGTIGSPPLLEYWLVDGKAPHGALSGMRVFSFDPANLKIENSGGDWCLAEGARTLFKFGRSRDDATLALDVIKKYDFSKLAVIGQAAPSMMIFLSGDNAAPNSRAHHQAIERDPARKDKDTKGPIVLARKDSNVTNLATPVVPPLQTTAKSESGPRTAFASGKIHDLPSGRQLGAIPARPDATKLADRVAFDWRLVQVRRADKSWVLAAGNHVLARFGDKEPEAQQALSLVRHFHLTEQLNVGQPPYFSFYLVNGKPPRGLPLGLNAIAFQPDALTVRPQGSRWALCDENVPLLIFGETPAEARKFLDLIRKERFDRLINLGVSREEGMTLLMKSR